METNQTKKRPCACMVQTCQASTPPPTGPPIPLERNDFPPPRPPRPPMPSLKPASSSLAEAYPSHHAVLFSTIAYTTVVLSPSRSFPCRSAAAETYVLVLIYHIISSLHMLLNMGWRSGSLGPWPSLQAISLSKANTMWSSVTERRTPSAVEVSEFDG